jgi:hypothetical protein
MRFQSVLALGLFSSVMAVPIDNAKMDLPSVQATFEAIQNGIDKLITDVRAYTGGPHTAFVADADAILSAIKAGTEKVAKSPAMGITDAIAILAPVGVLSSKIEEVVGVLATQKEVLNKGGAGPLILDSLKKQKSSADGLVAAILNNLPLPQVLGIIAGPIAKTVTDKLEVGIKQWS